MDARGRVCVCVCAGRRVTKATVGTPYTFEYYASLFLYSAQAKLVEHGLAQLSYTQGVEAGVHGKLASSGRRITELTSRRRRTLRQRARRKVRRSLRNFRWARDASGAPCTAR
eukprot:COSAG01_NODE_1372_length_10545_cov_12.262876_4_plen_113_part_00